MHTSYRKAKYKLVYIVLLYYHTELKPIKLLEVATIQVIQSQSLPAGSVVLYAYLV